MIPAPNMIEKAPFIIEIGLLGLKISRSQKLADIIAVSFKRQQLTIFHETHLTADIFILSSCKRAPPQTEISMRNTFFAFPIIP